EKRALAAFSSASWNATGVGGGAGAGAVCASPETDESTDPHTTRTEARMDRLACGASERAIWSPLSLQSSLSTSVRMMPGLFRRKRAAGGALLGDVCRL